MHQKEFLNGVFKSKLICIFSTSGHFCKVFTSEFVIVYHNLIEEKL